MVTTPAEEIRRRVTMLERHRKLNGTGRGFAGAASDLSLSVTTLKAWARRNIKFVPRQLYDDLLVLSPGELAARKVSIRKATEAARKTPRTKTTRPGRVKSVGLSEQVESLPPEQIDALDVLLTRIEELKRQLFQKNQQILDLQEQVRGLNYQNSQLSGKLTEISKQRVSKTVGLKDRLTKALSE